MPFYTQFLYPVIIGFINKSHRQLHCKGLISGRFSLKKNKTFFLKTFLFYAGIRLKNIGGLVLCVYIQSTPQ